MDPQRRDGLVAAAGSIRGLWKAELVRVAEGRTCCKFKHVMNSPSEILGQTMCLPCLSFLSHMVLLPQSSRDNCLSLSGEKRWERNSLSWNTTSHDNIHSSGTRNYSYYYCCWWRFPFKPHPARSLLRCVCTPSEPSSSVYCSQTDST